MKANIVCVDVNPGTPHSFSREFGNELRLQRGTSTVTHTAHRKILNYHFCFLQGRSRSLWGWRSDAAGQWRRNPLKTSGWDGGCRRKRSLQLHVHPQDSAAWRTWSPRSWRQGRPDPRCTASCAQDRPGNPQVRPFLLSKPRKRKKYK